MLPDSIVKPFPTNVNSEPTIDKLSGTLTVQTPSELLPDRTPMIQGRGDDGRREGGH
jgi:hypothetical protein